MGSQQCLKPACHNRSVTGAIWLLGPASGARTDRPGPTGDRLPLFVGLEFHKCISDIMLIAILESLHQLSLWGL